MMQKRKILFQVLSFIYIIAIVSGCVGMPKPEESNFKDPLIALDHVEISYYTGYYYFSKEVKPTKGKADNYGAPLRITFFIKSITPTCIPFFYASFIPTMKTWSSLRAVRPTGWKLGQDSLLNIYLSSLGMNIHSRIYLIDILYFSSI